MAPKCAKMKSPVGKWVTASLVLFYLFAGVSEHYSKINAFQVYGCTYVENAIASPFLFSFALPCS